MGLDFPETKRGQTQGRRLVGLPIRRHPEKGSIPEGQRSYCMRWPSEQGDKVVRTAKALAVFDHPGSSVHEWEKG